MSTIERTEATAPAGAAIAKGQAGAAGPTPGEFRVAGAVTLVGFGLMAAGAIIGATSGADIFEVVDSSSAAEIGASLTEVADASTAQMVNLALWIAGVPTIAVGIALVARLGREDGWAATARTAATVAAGAAVVFYALLMGVVRGLAPAHVAGEDVITVTRTVGWGASTADWVATLLVLGVATVAVVRSGRGLWAPEWLVRFGYVTGVAAVVALLGLVFGARDLTFLLVPVGMAYLASIGVVVVRRAR